MKKLLIALVLTVVIGGVIPNCPAADKPGDKPGEAKKDAKPKFRPFNGKVKAVDKTAKTITLEGEKAQTFHVTAETKINKEGKPATLNDVAAGEQVGGRAREGAEGKWDAVTVNVGKPAVKPPPKGDKPKKEDKK